MQRKKSPGRQRMPFGMWGHLQGKVFGCFSNKATILQVWTAHRSLHPPRLRSIPAILLPAIKLRKTPVSRKPCERFSEIVGKYAAGLCEMLPPFAHGSMQQTVPQPNPASLPHNRRREKLLRRTLPVERSNRKRKNWASSTPTFPNRWKPLKQAPVLQKRLTPP